MGKMIETEHQIESISSFSVKARIGFMLASLFPLLTPYSLLVRHQGSGLFNIFGAIALLISLGAASLSVILFLVAIFGLNQQIVIDLSGKTITWGQSHLLLRYAEHRQSFSEVKALDLVTHDWTDGPSSYELRLMLAGGKKLLFGSFDKKMEAERYKNKLAEAFGLRGQGSIQNNA